MKKDEDTVGQKKKEKKISKKKYKRQFWEESTSDKNDNLMGNA